MIILDANNVLVCAKKSDKTTPEPKKTRPGLPFETCPSTFRLESLWLWSEAVVAAWAPRETADDLPSFANQVTSCDIL